ncbi:tuftelin isoform X2 [Hyperolius riggenbachi]|uniref:tuftelin isoform X2 n=1 Tax=Hyperolius riggenbachi TaxID=752182 RepID=UPI0035A3571C
MNGLCTLQQLQPEPETDPVKTIRMTLREQSPERIETIKVKPIGRAFALVSSDPARRSRPLNSELIKSNDGDEEIIKVYLKAKAECKANHEWNVNQLKNEVRHIQEVQPTYMHNGVRHYEEPWSPSKEHSEEFPTDNGKNLRETAQKMYAKLQETEKRYQADRRTYEERINQYRQEVEHSNRARKQAQDAANQQQREVEELRRLMSNMEKENQDLLQKMRDNEKELESLRQQKQHDGPLQEKCQELEKTVANLKEKIHHLDDMQKSQQRKVRQMIEQLQNSRTAMGEKDAMIHELKEKVSWLQAENLELQDKLEHFLSTQPGQQTSYLQRPLSRPHLQNVKRVYIPAGSGRPMPLIRVVET